MNALIPIVIAGGITYLSELIEPDKKRDRRPRIVAGTFIFGAAVLALSETGAGELAVALAWVVAISALMLSGPTVFKAINEGV